MSDARTTAADRALRDDEAPPRPPWPELAPWNAAFVRAKLATRAQWPHALLLTAPRGHGKRVVALYLARALLCEHPGPDGAACAACDSCRYVMAGQHPDLRVVEPVVVDDDGEVKAATDITIDRIREITEFAGYTSHRGGARVALVMPAERMNVNAANALLKTLEEPPPGMMLILASDQPGRLPATIVSRCQRWPLPPPPAADVQAWLAAQGVADPATALAEAGGAPLLALERADADLEAERRAWLGALAKPRALQPAVLAARIDAAGKDERRTRYAAALDWMIGWATDLAAVAAGAPVRRNPDHAEALAALAPSVARISLSRYHRALLRQRALLQHPLTPRLAAVALLIDYQALFGDGP
ncbi:MAG: DNA polymerase III subunit delta' [Proteobacteria bacterium]|nr:DNA polymerase III subunit delta' [Pseudomonadota bacterium]